MTNQHKTTETSKNRRRTQEKHPKIVDALKKSIQEQFKTVEALMENLRIVFPLIKVRHQSQKLYRKVIM